MKLTQWLLFAAPILAAPAPSSRTNVEKRSEIPAAWTRLDAAPSPDQQFTLRIGLKQSNLHLLEEELLAVSDPKSAA